jgi:hypothetical protein
MKDFLTTFKEFENEIRNNTQYSSVKEYEESIENTDVQDKIRFLRIIRNYYSHHSDGEILVKINKSSIDFLEKQTQILLNSKLKVKDKYKSISKSQKIVKQSNIYSLINMLCKKNILSAYIIDKNSYLLGEIALPDLISKYFEFNTKQSNKTDNTKNINNTKNKNNKNNKNNKVENEDIIFSLIKPLSESNKKRLIVSKDDFYDSVDSYKLVGIYTENNKIKIYGEVDCYD